MKEIIKIWGAAVLVAVVGLLVAYNVGQDLEGLQAQMDAVANHEHVHEHDTSHDHDMSHSHDTSHSHDEFSVILEHEHSEIRAMLDLMFELEKKVNDK